ncbi:hypothetical protein [Nitrosomonas sp. GH22]|uniref:FDXHR family putative zinc-binding protein n=1 Tax=Nitrosomonas sp. GH22 TaxID=153947 RepID=UPI00136FA7CB|nr:hypothetical protein [Nitrosomonas sp. GH22]
MTKLELTGDRNQCPTCNEYFNSTAAFDKHRTGKYGVDRRCLTVQEMNNKGMSKNDAGFWITSTMPAKAYAARKIAIKNAADIQQHYPEKIIGVL